MSTIECTNLSQFIDVCAALVRQGIIFKAYGDTMTIKLTGGF